MNRPKFKGALAQGLLYAMIILVVDGLALGVAMLILGRNLWSYYTLLPLLEATPFLYAGYFKPRSIIPVEALKPQVTAEWSLITTGLILLAASFAFAYPLRFLYP
jgi:hypothetical protein